MDQNAIKVYDQTTIKVYDQGVHFLVTGTRLGVERVLATYPTGSRAAYPEARESLRAEAADKVNRMADNYPGSPVYWMSPCTFCAGSGKRFDPTNMDRVNAGPATGECWTCGGTGEVAKLAHRQPTADELAAIPESDPTAAIPEWMKG